MKMKTPSALAMGTLLQGISSALPGRTARSFLPP